MFDLTKTTIPKNALVALPDFNNPQSGSFIIVPPEKAYISAFDRSFHFGDSVYEVTRSYEGILFSLPHHLERLERSSRLAAFDFEATRQLIADRIPKMILETCQSFFKKFGKTDLYVRMTISRGQGDLNIDTQYAGAPYPVVIVKTLSPFPEKIYTEGVHCALVDRRRMPREALDPAMKSGNYLNNVLALHEAKLLGASEAIMLNPKGYITEGTTTNIFGIQHGTVITAPVDSGILAGITREWILKACQQLKISVQEKCFTDSEFLACEETFLSSSTKEVVPITTLTTPTISKQKVGDGKPGKLTQAIGSELKKIIQKYITQHQTESLYL